LVHPAHHPVPVNAVVGWVDAGVGVYWRTRSSRSALAQIQMEADAMRTDRVENARLRRLLDLSQENPSDLTAAGHRPELGLAWAAAVTIYKDRKTASCPNAR